MFKKNSILDRKVRATAYAANIESEDRQYNQEVAYWSSKRDKNSETHDRIRRAFDPEDQERVEDFERVRTDIQDQLAARQQQRVEEEAERKAVPEWDFGYRSYSSIPWHDRVNPWAGNEDYEKQMRRAYLRHVMAENQQLEMERNVMRQYERDLDAYEAHQASTDAGVAGKFFNKDQDRVKWMRGMKLGRPDAPTAAYAVRDGNPGILEWHAPTERPTTAPAQPQAGSDWARSPGQQPQQLQEQLPYSPNAPVQDASRYNTSYSSVYAAPQLPPREWSERPQTAAADQRIGAAYYASEFPWQWQA